jgi:putative endopeptidase
MTPDDADITCDNFAAAIAPVRLDARDLDHAVNPREDLDAFVNARWRRENPIPAGYSCWDCFSILNERSLRLQAAIALECARDCQASVEQRIVGDFWATGIDAGESARQGLKTLSDELQRIGVLDSPESIAAYLRECLTQGRDPLFSLDVQPDFADPHRMIVFIVPQGLGLPDRDLYFDTTPAGASLQAAYAAHVALMFELSGVARADSQRFASDVVEFERRLAGVSISRRALARDVAKRYNPISIEDADRISPGFSWSSFFSSLQLCPERFSLAVPEFHAEIGALLRTASMQTWRGYLCFHAIDQAAPYLSEEIAEAHDRFHGVVLRGRQSAEPRWKRALTVLNANVGEAMGKLYAARHCRRETYARIDELVGELRQVMRERIENLDWMSATTKQSALKKLAVFTAKIGFPSQWRDWSALATTRRSWYANIIAARAFNRRWTLAQLNKPVDPASWSLTPQTVNARYDPQRNEIILPGAILQPPFFDPDADMALNYGGIGAVIAHEMIHGYDDQGSRFGPGGRFENWWTSDDRTHFDALAAQLVEHFNNRACTDSEPVDGLLTLGENIADLGGLALASDALRRALVARGAADPMLDGFSQVQRFFLNWAVLWRQNLTPDERRLRRKTDPHAPGKLRANVAAASVPAYAEAFDGEAADSNVGRDAGVARIW